MATYATKLEALQECLKIWLFLRSRPDIVHKRQAYAELGIPTSRDLHCCPACEYTAVSAEESQSGWKTIQSCKECPVWGSGHGKGSNYMCEQERSPYSKWTQAWASNDRKTHANNMVRLIRKRMKEHA